MAFLKNGVTVMLLLSMSCLCILMIGTQQVQGAEQPRCMDKLSKCPDLGKRGYCDRRRVQKDCPYSCGQCEGYDSRCVNQRPECDVFAKRNDCYRRSRYMEKNCPLACKMCRGIPQSAT